MFKRFLSSTSPDAQNQSKDASFIELSLILQRGVNRSLKQSELSTVWSLDNEQTAVLTNLLKEAKGK
ncbi:hypothetical protein H70357_24770 [Paenibacillus sp. FSL H7-0357]|uniref:hypothetical protein n=1 Tax=Paenibacillus sp. FSL H7-0357 TaxID=1536774 RepID=UPI0004F6E966|nr:hypothetical protein [Paenibacillus sp. FSL H7-0357]AIQ19563.1 hypothetical protein H70357_24770 [Paenibacillus sp. FSL H7-0357]